MTKQLHFITRQTIELKFSSETDAEGPWEKMPLIHRQQGMPLLSEVFDRLVPDDVFIKLDRLDIDLGRIRPDLFEQEYLRKLERVLEQKLAQSVRRDQGITRSSGHKVWEENFIHYLVTGQLFWESSQTGGIEETNHLSNLRDIEKKYLDCLESSPGFVQRLKLELRHHPLAMKRWVRELSTGFHRKCRQMFLNETPHSLRSLQESAVSSVISYQETHQGISHDEKEYQQILSWKLLCSSAENEIFDGLTEWIGFSSLPLRDHEKQTLRSLLQKGSLANKRSAVLSLKDWIGLSDSARAEGFHAIIKEWNASGGKEKDDREPSEASPANRPISGKDPIPELEKQIKSERTGNLLPGEDGKQSLEKESSDNQTEWQDPSLSPDRHRNIYIENAGLILLYPFLSSYFKEAGVQTGRKLSEEDASAGISLLQVLVDGALPKSFVNLSLNKLLCGRPPEWPLMKVDLPVKNLAKNAEQLLSSAIRHWAALRNTSPEGLRETFLKRPGKLFRDQGQWHLWVEYKTVDILLQSLPWTWSIILLPWMSSPIYVEW